MFEVKLDDLVYSPYTEVIDDNEICLDVHQYKVIDISQRGNYLIRGIRDFEEWYEGTEFFSDFYATCEEALEAGKQQVLSRLHIEYTTLEEGE